MRNLYLAFLSTICSISINLQAQENIGYTWGKVLNNSSPLGGNVQVKAIKTDASNNVYVTGTFSESADFDPGPGNTYLSSPGYTDIFLAKYSAAGSLLFVKQIIGTYSDNVSSLELDASGNVYLAGEYNTSIDLDPGSAVASVSGVGNSDVFFAKYDANGNYLFGKAVGGTSVDMCYSIAVDASNYIYITGSFYNTVDFNPGAGTANLTSAGQEDIFVAKYDQNGDYLLAQRFGGTSFDAGKGIAVDGTGNMYVTGYFRNTVDFDPGAGTVSFTSPASADDIFLTKYNSSGNLVYARQIGGSSSDQATSIMVDGSGNVYFAGIFAGTTDFDAGAGTVNLTSAGSVDIFIAKYNATGTYVYAKGMGGTGYDLPNDLAIDASGNIYIAGYFQNTVDFDPGAGTANLISNGNNEAFFAKYDASGNYVFAKGMGGTSGETANTITLNSSNQIVVGGAFNGTVDFDPGAGTANLPGATSASNGFVGSYDNSGIYLSAMGLGGLSGAGANDLSESIAVDGNGNVYVAGNTKGAVDFDPGPGTANKNLQGITDAFFAKYNTNGNYVFAHTLGGASGDAQAKSIRVDADGNICLVGYFSGAVDFDPGAGTATLTSTGLYDIFIAKYDANGNYLFAKSMGSTSNDYCNKLVLDASGNFYIAGYFRNTVDFDPGAGTVNLTSAGAEEIFFAKYDANGNYVYAKSIGGTGIDFGLSLAIDASNNLYLTGSFSGTADLDPGTGTANFSSSVGYDYDLFFAKYDASGNYVLAKAIGGNGNDQGRNIALDASGNIYLAATFSQTVDFDPGAGTANLVGSFSDDIAIAKYDASGNYVYAKQLTSSATDIVTDLVLDANGHVYITGYSQGDLDFDPGAGVVKVNGINSANIFFARYDANGNYVNAKGLPGYNGRGTGIVLDGNDLIITGSVLGDNISLGLITDLDPGAAFIPVIANNSGDIFMAKYSTCAVPAVSDLTTNASPATVTAATSLTDGGCRLLATVEPGGASPVNGTVNAKLWIENSVPTYAGQPFVARHYEITPATDASTATGRVTLYFTQQEFTDFNNHPGSALDLPTAASDAVGIANLRVGKYSGSSNNGTGLPGSYTNGAVIIDPDDVAIVWNPSLSRWEISFDVTGFSGFIVQTTATPLPVSLTQFTAQKNAAQVLLKWTTANEQDNKGFAVERSSDGRNFGSIGYVQATGNGNSNVSQEYNFTDANPLPGKNFYRLQQQDVDGSVAYSMVRQINFNKSFAVVLYPNPVGTMLMIDLQNTQPQQLYITLTDLQGRMIRNWSYKQAAGLLQLNLGNIKPGYYQLELLNDKGDKEVHRLLKQ